MRQLARRHGINETLPVRYAEAEMAGKAPRKSNVRSLPPLDYARRLLADGTAKGWLRC